MHTPNIEIPRTVLESVNKRYKLMQELITQFAEEALKDPELVKYAFDKVTCVQEDLIFVKEGYWMDIGFLLETNEDDDVLYDNYEEVYRVL